MNGGTDTHGSSEDLAYARVGLVGRLRARRGEVVEAIFARVKEVVSEPAAGEASAEHLPEYLQGLRAAVLAAIDYVIGGIEWGDRESLAIPGEVLAQARRAAREGINLDTVLRRYIVGNTLLAEFVIQEIDRLEPVEQGNLLRDVLRAQASLLDELVAAVSREYADERHRAERSSEHRLLERVRMLLVAEHASDPPDAPAWGSDRELGYRLEAQHLGLIASGSGAAELLEDLAVALDRRLFSVAPGEQTVWAWLGGQRALRISDLDRALAQQQAAGVEVVLAIGEPARGLAGWRLTHQQARAAFAVALRRPRRPARYTEVALLASALKDELLASALLEIYVAPLRDARDGGAALRQTLRAYIDSGRRVSSTASALELARSTVVSRLRTVEERLGRSLSSCLAELEVALRLDELDEPPPF